MINLQRARSSRNLFAAGESKQSAPLSHEGGVPSDDGRRPSLRTWCHMLKTPPRLRPLGGMLATPPPPPHKKHVKLVEACAYDCVSAMAKRSLELLHACKVGDVDQAARLLARTRHKPCVNVREPVTGNSPLQAAAALGQVNCVKLLLQAGAAVNHANFMRMTPLMNAAAGGFDRVVALLLQHGANVAARNEHGQTALMIAAMENSKACVALLLAHGADPDEEDESGVAVRSLPAAHLSTKNLMSPVMFMVTPHLHHGA